MARILKNNLASLYLLCICLHLQAYGVGKVTSASNGFNVGDNVFVLTESGAYICLSMFIYLFICMHICLSVYNVNFIVIMVC